MMRPQIAVDGGAAKDRRAVVARLLLFLRPYWPWLLLVLFLIVLNALVTLASPLLIGRAIDGPIVQGDAAGLVRLMALLLASYVLGLLTIAGQFRIMGWVGQQALSTMRRRIFDRVQGLSLRYFAKHEAGDLMSRLVNDVDTINQLLSNGLVQLLGSVLTLIGITIAMFLLNWPLALATFAIVPVMLLTTRYFSRRARVAYRKTRSSIGAVSAALEEDISGVRVAQAFNRGDANRTRFAQLNRANRDANVQAVGLTSAFSPALDVLSTVDTAIVIGYGGVLVLHGGASVGLIVAFLGYVQQFFRPIQQLSQLYTQMQAALAGGERIFELLDEPQELVERPDAPALPPAAGHIVFEHVDFAYEPGVPVLHDISLEARPGQTVAIVGPTGSGKTTLINLLLRFYDVTGGRISVDGHDVRDVTAASLRSQTGVVIQDSFLFAASVADNIRYGRLDATDPEVEQAARLVNAHDFIAALPEGYNTMLGERGRSISQGQRQLLAFARALLANPRILILDEATSNVDTRTEALIQNALTHLLERRTSLVIAHRLSTIRDADLVVVLQAGRIVEQGAHETLLAQGGVYADLYARQFRDAPPATLGRSA